MTFDYQVEMRVLNSKGTNSCKLLIKTEIDHFTSASANANSSQAEEKINFRNEMHSSDSGNNLQETINNSTSTCINEKEDCKKCKKFQKELKKQIKQQNIRETNIYYEQLQNELYRKALLRLKEGDQSIKQRIITAYRSMETKVNDSALKYAQRHCQKYGINDVNPIVIVYKILLLPEEVLKKFVQAEDKAILRQEYKFYSLNIHPDKNKHQKALFAFQKMKTYWNDIPNQSHH
ncbi:unnamed protein product (macronuclear) [Paramecium tetraurelia]|uniref:J domain-containing protein n=1 Tax=Paramecium tetraurelia TaxID=5888 RepID=A0DCC6_PARTE|nr:uncharacterized protein GSPATT00015571001 [Paramecium tetraurelia]CAK80693.1 unnamed protein product [Paramecium tetraurelia]|eukprot:XP_001448090.1 hypothetical protein (macronuclear) [Paramecium tetraurelia strain d4-2]